MMPASVLASFATVKLPLLDWFENFKSGDKIYPTAAAASVSVFKYTPGNGGFPRQGPLDSCRTLPMLVLVVQKHESTWL